MGRGGSEFVLVMYWGGCKKIPWGGDVLLFHHVFVCVCMVCMGGGERGGAGSQMCSTRFCFH